METRKQVLKEELQKMKNALMVEMKKMLKEELILEIKKELVVEKENLLKIVEEIKNLKTDLDNKYHLQLEINVFMFIRTFSFY